MGVLFIVGLSVSEEHCRCDPRGGSKQLQQSTSEKVAFELLTCIAHSLIWTRKIYFAVERFGSHRRYYL